MALIERKGVRRVSGGLRVEGGGLRRFDLESKESGRVDGRLGDGGGVDGGMISTESERDQEVKDVDIQPGSLRVSGPPKYREATNGDVEIEIEDSLPATPPPERQKNKLKDVEGQVEDDTLRSPETPARLDSFDIDKDDPTCKQTIAGDEDFEDPSKPVLPYTPDTRQPRRTNPFPTSKSTPLPLPSADLSSTSPPGAPRKSRSSSISSFLSSLRQSATRPFFPSWTSVGHKSGVPERLVVSSIPDEVGQVQVRKEGIKVGSPIEAREAGPDGWTTEVKVQGGRGWTRSNRSDYGWGDDDQEEPWEEEVDDAREQLAGIANRTALVLEEGQVEDEGGQVGTGALGISWESDYQDDWEKFEGDERDAVAGFVEDESGSGDLVRPCRRPVCTVPLGILTRISF